MSVLQAYRDGLLARVNEALSAGETALHTAALVCADAVAARKVIHIHDTGHLISHELVARVGGLVNFTHFSYQGQVNSDNLYRERTRRADTFAAQQQLIRWALMQGHVEAGDVMVIGSVSGTSAGVVELAHQARQLGVQVVAVTSGAFSASLASQHPTGQRLMDAADIVLDNYAPIGDSFLTLEGQPKAICPVSGVTSVCLMWGLTSLLVEELNRRGLKPSVYESVNLPDGMQNYQLLREEYAQTGL